MKQKSIILTGGGTAGHVSLNQAIIPSLIEEGYDVHYIGSHDGIEKELISGAFPNIPYHSISSGKLRRYFSMKNFTDPFKVLAGIGQALAVIRKVKPTIIFSKGGFVSVPVVIAAKLSNIPVVIHESDVTPGLANKIALPFASHVFTIFQETLKYLPSDKSTCTGSIVRQELFQGNKSRGKELCDFKDDKKILLIMGGSLGSVVLNDALRSNLPELLVNYNVIHLCGKGNVDQSLRSMQGYKQFDYVTNELSDLLYAADFVVSRAGSNSIFEFLALKKPMLLIPLSASKSRGDQILNANIFNKQGFAQVLEEELLSKKTFMKAIQSLVAQQDEMIDSMLNAESPKTPDEMVKLITQYEK
ncbi:UDP-N-acetylglucosamine--N-acetylmuramyl-(pentapeptide) pyrophosphoryl-undecaprenol N-acetylglucosamine transferase [Lysinibacillus composti]|uniref:UDP-N-acetylglucosamine--N-acetylmuramyl-(pentapeptide) pyrophosphoryl-undecaprenol N-acetylglucosamine transferase n=1 Tax=Lysinibacillus composti TaxID=720633 RepID=A0A3N9UI86_9BACI|nr:undecaprenyldiphospho-muramoylpentapeptide beta-N-acetylglucosaminyltransferase [Lysinibacillus composti]MBM7607692.1 UDP-N-acetylglucosamine--N-acetylmuramyl-(pentapeptide) pyrophosphoryl-undecaprenol N-acetylglucosamine transferase [Lysinibacillus composti]RQW75813.1 undecaprenyldiphospho-muramoylpentapeptide beta-N-acetylglucosaminyltransferase [Lysinibacillus composti]